ncbi:undecaprenyl-diphosphate phosphatase [Candidatus Bathyarchaeota archaeon]|nr:undecaprenyl-diphosphate phosphatase [Candidatus Bathyarchaeota archaeon]
MLTLSDAIIIGIFQGLLEWLPISSRGNIILLITSIMNLPLSDTLQLSIFVHFGTALAAALYFRSEIINILLRKNLEYHKIFLFLLISTVITGIIGAPIYVFIEETLIYGELILAITGIALIINSFIQKKTRLKNDQLKTPNIKDGVIIGFIQGFSAIPGLSRSGLTTSSLLFRGFSSEDAFKLSFLMSIPVSIGASFGSLIIKSNFIIDQLVLATLFTSFIIGYLSIDILLKLVRRIKFWKTCLLLGVIMITVFLTGLIF